MGTPKCGNCGSFVVRNTSEAELARIARPESECGAGEWVFQGIRKAGCHGGPVMGQCRLWRERGVSSPAVASTFWCQLWSAGGPHLRQVGGSINRSDPGTSECSIPRGGLLAAGALLFAARWVGVRWSQRGQ